MISRLIISMLQRHTRSEIACSECSQVLFKKSSLFTVPGACGMVGSYVNSMGYVRTYSTTFIRIILQVLNFIKIDFFGGKS